ncbi:hypothetical protein RFI_28555, partial [Reticulomyxa filosa]
MFAKMSKRPLQTKQMKKKTKKTKKTKKENDDFYTSVFKTLGGNDRTNTTLQGGQVFEFFKSSRLNRDVLAGIWDEATQRQPGGLNSAKFKVALQLITLAQHGIPPKLANLSDKTPPPQLQYPPIQGQQLSSGVTDPFNWLSEKTGEIKTGSTSSLVSSNDVIRGQGQGQGQGQMDLFGHISQDSQSNVSVDWTVSGVVGGGGVSQPQSKRESPVLGSANPSTWYASKRASTKTLPFMQDDNPLSPSSSPQVGSSGVTGG